MSGWEKIYQEYGIVQQFPDNFIVRAIKVLKSYNIKNIYDYGAGTGRNAIFLAKRGYKVLTHDPSSSSKKLLIKKIWEKKSESIEILEYPLNKENSVDCVIAIKSIHHGKYKEIKRDIDYIISLVKKRGLILFKCLAQEDFSSDKGEKLEEGTRVNIPLWADGNVPHHFFSENELRNLFSKTDIILLEKKVENVEFFPDAKHHYFELIVRKK